ncbi:S8 family serine peptidase [Streptomyces sp. HNM0574]|uniref:S8 family peptidase n=1 Tax=Streptomyces sp. HNM0574 TaxID=2714954 RepID=UPI00146F18FD|nr:S8 family serine peptidase [Streptomyces sp. HNM0574]NLU67422.1 S8 family serine peptidase [Streptomyces sp. HNM0574]
MPLGLLLTAALGLGGTAVATAQDTSAQGTDGARTAAAQGGEKLSYVVNTEADADAVDRVERAVKEAGGSVVTAYDQIGVVVAHSSSPRFAKDMRAVPGVDSAGATRTAPIKAAGTTDVGKPQFVQEPGATTRAKADGEEPLEPLQWDKRVMKADRAHEISEGSERVTVGVIDTGVDDTHPDLKDNFAADRSANCVGGKADTSPGSWRPYNAKEDYHGTHVAGIVAAARNGTGIAGAAPGVSLSAIKVSEPETSLFYTEAVVCAMVFAADHGIDITNNSYYVDPWLYACRDDEDQKALVDAVSRSLEYATGKGVAHVTSAGNSSHDMAAEKLTDDTSPNDSKPVKRTIDMEKCADMPTQLDGVTSVAASGPENGKSYYSNYGLGQIDVTGPGGDSRYQQPEAPAKNGGVLSTMPGGDYAYLQGTSMAGPQVAGVAALIKSEHPEISPQELAWRLKAQAAPEKCPKEYDPDGKGTYAAECTGTDGDNSFYGHGIVDALAAVTK